MADTFNAPTDANRVAGGASKADIDHVNIWMRSTPWYQQILQQYGGNAKSDAAKQAITTAAQQHGIVIDEGNIEVDGSGNLRGKGHKLRNTLIVAGIAAASLATMGAAGVFAGAGGVGAGAASGTGAAAGLGGIEGAAVLGGVTPGTMAAAGLAPTAIGAAGSAGLAGTTAATAGGSGVLGQIGSALKTGSALKGLGTEIGAATNAAGNNRLNQEQLGLQANGQNISGQSAFETELMNRARTESDQRKDALKDVYRQSYASNRKPGPFNTAGLTPYSANYTGSLDALSQQGTDRLKTGATYDTTKMTPLTPYKPVNIADVQGSTGTKKGTLENIGDWLGPGLSIYDKISQAYGRS